MKEIVALCAVARLALALTGACAFGGCSHAGPATRWRASAAPIGVPVVLGPHVAIGERPCIHDIASPDRTFHRERTMVLTSAPFGSQRDEVDEASSITPALEAGAGDGEYAVRDVAVYVLMSSWIQGLQQTDTVRAVTSGVVVRVAPDARCADAQLPGAP